MECLDESAALDWVEGRVPAGRHAELLGHLDGCVDCAALVSALAAQMPVAHANVPTQAGDASSAAPAVGERFGRYELIRRLGKGGMAEVFLARQTGPSGYEKLCVLKRVLPERAADPRFLRLFLDEARLAAQLNHPHIAQTLDFGELEGVHFLAMEYVPGADLRALLGAAARRGERLPLPCAIRICSQVASALDYAHRATDAQGRPLGIVHRDVTPANVMVSSAGSAKLIDFGIARARQTSEATQVGTLKGNAWYMSPEQATGASVDRRSDVYGLGLLLYECLSGRRAISGADYLEAVAAAQDGRIVPLAQKDSKLPAPLLSLVERALERDRERRIDSAGTILQELEAYLTRAGETVTEKELAELLPALGLSAVQPGVEATSVTLPATLPGPPMGQRRRWLAIAAVVALAAGIAGWAWARAGTRPTASVETGPPPPTAAAPVLAPTPPVPPPPSPQPSSGELWVRSSPRLEVIVDDRARGRTPLRLDLPGGLHKLVLKDEDLGLHHGRQIHVAPGGSQTEQWNAAKGWVTFHAAPYAQVFWGRKALGVTPINRMPFWEGHHTFTFVDPETRHSARRQVDVVAEQESVVKVDLRE